LDKGDGRVGEELDFERAWLGKLSTHLDEIAGEQIRKQVLQGSEALTSESPRETVIDWTRWWRRVTAGRFWLAVLASTQWMLCKR